MAKHMLLESLLSGEENISSTACKGVCQKCGHYTTLSMSHIGTRICNSCEDDKQIKLVIKK